MNAFITWLSNLSTGILGSIIAAIICALVAGSTVAILKRRKSKLKISSSDIGGDVVMGDKLRQPNGNNQSIKDIRVSSASIKETKVHGDVVQGDKEG